MRTQSKNKKTTKVRENAGDKITIGFRLASDWFRASRWFFEPIVERSKAKPRQSGLHSTLN